MKAYQGFRWVFPWLIISLVILSARVLEAEPQKKDQFKDLREAAIGTLRTVMASEKEWVKVHAAEMLIFNNYPQGVREAFEAEQEQGPGPKYRIGVWRVLAQAAGNDKAMRKKYIDKIVAAFKDKGGPDRLHAVETLGKLGYKEVSPELMAVSKEGQGVFQAYARWVVANSGRAEDEASLAELLDSDDASVRGCVAYALRYFGNISDATFEKLAHAVSKEPADSTGRFYLLSALYVHARRKERKRYGDAAKNELLRYIKTGGKAEKNEVCSALAEGGGLEDRQRLAALLKDAEADVRAHAANALLRIDRRQFRGR